MHSVAAQIWNDIAKTQTLKTPLAKRLFPLPPDEMEAAIAQEVRAIAAREGADERVALAYMTVAPLLWEREAIAGYKRKNPAKLWKLEGVLLEVLDATEALIIADGDFRLSDPQREILRGLLSVMPGLSTQVSELEPVGPEPAIDPNVAVDLTGGSQTFRPKDPVMFLAIALKSQTEWMGNPIYRRQKWLDAEATLANYNPADWRPSVKHLSLATIPAEYAEDFRNHPGKFDPDLAVEATQMAALQIKAGARGFYAYVRTTLVDLGLPLKAVRPYLRMSYNSAREILDDEDQYVSDLDSAEEVAILAKRLGDVFWDGADKT